MDVHIRSIDMFTIILRKEVAGQPMYMHFNINGGYALCYHTDQNNTYVPKTQTSIPRDIVFHQINWCCDHLDYKVQLDTRFENEEEYYQAVDEAHEIYSAEKLYYSEGIG